MGYISFTMASHPLFFSFPLFYISDQLTDFKYLRLFLSLTFHCPSSFIFNLVPSISSYLLVLYIFSFLPFFPLFFLDSFLLRILFLLLFHFLLFLFFLFSFHFLHLFLPFNSISPPCSINPIYISLLFATFHSFLHPPLSPASILHLFYLL